MSRYDGLIIPRSYSEYINKTDAATLQQALQLSGVLSNTVAANDSKAVRSSAVNTILGNYQPLLSYRIIGGESVNTEIYLNKALQPTNSYKYQKAHLILLSAISGLGNTISTKLLLISIGRSGNTITQTVVAQKNYSSSMEIIDNIQFLPSRDTTEVNDDNTLIIKNNNSNVNYHVNVRFL